MSPLLIGLLIQIAVSYKVNAQRSDIPSQNVSEEIIYPKREPVKLSLKQGLLMNQVITLYVLDKAEDKMCRNHSIEFRNSLRAFEPWALKMFDASSKIQSGILMGNLVQFGDFTECLSISQPSEFGKIDGKYCLLRVFPTLELIEKILSFKNVSKKRFAKLRITVEKMSLGWSVCVPKVCPTNDILKHFEKLILDTTEGLGLSVSLDENYCYTTDSIPKIGTIQYLVLIFFGLIIALCIAAGFVDYFKISDQKHSLFLAFSAYSNLKKLLSVGTVSGQNMEYLAGIKVISCWFVVMGHCYFMYIFFPNLNSLIILDWLLDYSNTAILGSTVTVDSFFMISGMLVALGFFEHVTKTNYFNLPIFYVHRYLRITVPLAFIILFYNFLAQLLVTGPLMYDAYAFHQKHCQDYWWSSLLHIQGYVNPGKLCVFPIWYLSCDMTFFFLSPIILYPLWKYPKFGKYMGFGLILFFLGLSFYLAWINEYTGEMLPVTSQLFDLDYFRNYYVTPHTRVTPYIMGILFGYYLFNQNKNGKVKISLLMNLTGWTISLVLMLFTVMYSHVFHEENHEYSKWEAAMYLTFGRSVWTLCITWIMWVCKSGNGGVVNMFLSWNFFRVLNRLTYGIFLIHSIVQVYTYTGARLPLNLTTYNAISNSTSQFAISVFLSFLFTLFFEFPLVQAQKLLFQGKSKEGPTKVAPIK